MIKRIIAAVVALCAMTASAYAATAYDPIPLVVPNLAAWYDLSYTPGVTVSGGLATAIVDRSGNGNSLISTYTANPTYTTNCQNGLPCITGNYYSSLITASTTTINVGSNPSTIVIAGTNNFDVSATTLSMAAGYGTFTTSQWRAFGITKIATGQGWAYGALFAQDVASAATTLTAGTPFVITGTASTPGISIQANGYVQSQNFVGAPNTVGSQFYIGHVSGYGPWGGNIFEILVYNSVLTSSQIQLIEGYLACKWGFQNQLASGHPYATYCPTAANPFFL